MDAVRAGKAHQQKYHENHSAQLTVDEVMQHCGLKQEPTETYGNLRAVLVCVDAKSPSDGFIRMALNRGNVASAPFCNADFIFLLCSMWKPAESDGGKIARLRFARFKRPFRYTEVTCGLLNESLRDFMQRSVMVKARRVLVDALQAFDKN